MFSCVLERSMSRDQGEAQQQQKHLGGRGRAGARGHSPCFYLTKERERERERERETEGGDVGWGLVFDGFWHRSEQPMRTSAIGADRTVHLRLCSSGRGRQSVVKKREKARERERVRASLAHLSK